MIYLVVEEGCSCGYRALVEARTPKDAAVRYSEKVRAWAGAHRHTNLKVVALEERCVGPEQTLEQAIANAYTSRHRRYSVSIEKRVSNIEQRAG